MPGYPKWAKAILGDFEQAKQARYFQIVERNLSEVVWRWIVYYILGMYKCHFFSGYVFPIYFVWSIDFVVIVNP